MNKYLETLWVTWFAIILLVALILTIAMPLVVFGFVVYVFWG